MLFAFACSSFVAAAANRQRGWDGSVTAHIPPGLGNQARSLGMQIHGLEYADIVSVRINQGSYLVREAAAQFEPSGVIPAPIERLILWGKGCTRSGRDITELLYFQVMTPDQYPLAFIGTWRLIDCETSHPQLPYPKLSLTTFVQREDGMHGNWCPVAGSALADSVTLQVLDHGSVEGKMRKGESASEKNRMTVSADGQVMKTIWEILGQGGVTITWKTSAQRQ